jgi:hypothetical protein
MTTKTLKSLVAISLAAGLAHSVLAQPAGQTNYNWSAGGDKATWNQTANWVQGLVPPTNGTTYQIYVDDNYPTSARTPVNIAATDTVILSDAVYGPTWGETLNIRGTVNAHYGMFIWGDGTSGVSTLNLYSNAVLSASDTIAFGTAWWFPGGPNAVMNVYDNAQVNVTWFQFGAHLNVYGGIINVTNGLNTGTATTPVFSGGLDTDATRSINLAGGKLVLPGSYTATVNDWISRGILLVDGVANASSQITIDEANPTWPGRTVVTSTSLGPILAMRIELSRTNLIVGGLEQAQVFADYATVNNANVTGLSSVSIAYQSSATGVVTVATNGMVRATGLGNATVNAIIGSLSNSVAVTVSAYTNTTSLLHRYSFSETAGSTTAADSIPGNSPTWDGSLNGGASLNGSQLVLDGVDGFVQFPSGILSGLDAVTVETWASFGTIGTWANLFAFGDSDGTLGHNYITCQPHTGPATAQTGIKNASSEQNPFFTPVLDNYTNVHIVAVFHPLAGYCSIYTNGMLAGINSSITIPLADALSTGDPLNYIGHSLYSADPFLAGYLDEFRIYNGPLTAGQIKADAALGPNQLIGVSTNTSLTVTKSSGNLIIKWPTTSALVSLMSSPVLGSGAVWTQVNAVPVVVGGNYQVTLPVSSSNQFYRLQQ